MHPRLAVPFASGAVRRSAHPELASLLSRARASGEIVAPFRGVYVDAAREREFSVRVAALALADPHAVFCGATTAFLMGWRDEPPDVEAGGTHLRSRPGYALDRRATPRSLTRQCQGVRCSGKALTVLELVASGGAAAIDDGLRRRVSLASLEDAYALTRNRPGHQRVGRLLSDSRSEPWSAAERAAHQALRQGGVRGWRANYCVSLGREEDAFLDIAFIARRLGLEIDGWRHHGERSAFLRDRRRDVLLAAAGWSVVRFAAEAVLNRPEEFVAAVRQVLAARDAKLCAMDRP